MFPIMCVMSFLENSPTDFYADLRDQFIEAVGESKLSELKPQLLDGAYVKAYQYCSTILAENNGGQNIQSIVESICSVHKANLKNVKWFDNENVINYLREELLSRFCLELVKLLLYILLCNLLPR